MYHRSGFVLLRGFVDANSRYRRRDDRPTAEPNRRHGQVPARKTGRASEDRRLRHCATRHGPKSRAPADNGQRTLSRSTLAALQMK